MLEIVYASLISGIFAVICLVILHFSWISKLKWTAQIEETKLNKEVKVARIKQPQPKYKRMPKNWMNQLQDAMELLGDERIQQLLGVFQGKEEDIGDNKVLTTLLNIGQGILQGQQQQQQQPEQSAY